jgi:uncharacterized membrane protein YphA (DoxX/SURF4 family)
MVPYSRAYEHWAPAVARWIFGLQFLIGALFKITWHSAEVAQTAAVGVPLPEIAVWLAFIWEVVAGISLIIGWKADPMVMGEFISHLSFIAGLLYVSVYGAQHIAVKKDPLPNT